MISRNLQQEIQRGNKQRRLCRNNHIYGKPFIRGRFYKVKCKKCQREDIIIKSELEKYGGLI